ncbi:MAG: PilZ domain-containing protein [Caulobacterales bacterium]
MDDTLERNAERRRGPRRRVLLGGKLVYGPDGATQDCAIKDISEAGARVRSRTPVEVDAPMFLLDKRHHLAFEVEVIWRDGVLLGLAFTRGYDLQHPPADLPDAIRVLAEDLPDISGAA